MTDREVQSISAHFEGMYEEGIRPWEEHGMEPHIARFAGLLLAEVPEPRLLDLGCGSGWVSVYFGKRGISVEGIDSSPTAIHDAEEGARLHGVADRVRFRVGNALDFSYPDASFDAVYDRGFFHHVPEDEYPRYLAGVARVLRPRGLLSLSVFSTNNRADIGHRFTEQDLVQLFVSRFTLESLVSDPWPTSAPAHLLHAVYRKEANALAL